MFTANQKKVIGKKIIIMIGNEPKYFIIKHHVDCLLNHKRQERVIAVEIEKGELAFSIPAESVKRFPIWN